MGTIDRTSWLVDARLTASAIAAGAFSFLLMVAYVPGWSGAATTPRWALLFAAVPVVSMFTDCSRVTLGHALGAAFLACAIVTLIWTPNGFDGIDALLKLLLLAALVRIGAELTSIAPFLAGAALGLGVNSGFAIAQWLGFEPVYRAPGLYPATGLFMNGNYLAEPAALVLIGLVAHRMWRFVPLVLPALVLPRAAGALLALVAAGFAALPWRARVVFLALVTLAIAGYLALMPLAGPGILHRITLWAATLDGLSWFGNGLGSFYTLFPSHAPAWDFLASRPAHAHNDFLEIAYELGLGGLPLLGFLAFAFAAPWRPEHFILLGFCVEACFGFPLHLPATLFLGGLVAGLVCRDRISLRDALAGGGMALCAGLERLARAAGACPSRHPRCFGLSARPPA